MDTALVVSGVGVGLLSLVHLWLFTTGLARGRPGAGIAGATALFLLTWSAAFIGLGTQAMGYDAAAVLMMAAALVAGVWGYATCRRHDQAKRNG